MSRIAQYRLFGLVLTVIFCVFSVGLPIVVASCPMMNSTMKAASKAVRSCCAEPTAPGTRVSTAMNRDCCRTIIAADRNTNEFVQSHTVSGHSDDAVQGALVLSPSLTLIATVAALAPGASDFSPPSRAGDLPVLFSSLLI